MQRRTLSIMLYLVGGVLLLSILLIGPHLDALMKVQGLNQFMLQQPVPDKILFFLFAFAFPIGILLCAIGGMVASMHRPRQLVIMIATLGILMALVVFWPAVSGRQHSPLYFGAGGTILLLLIFAVSWYWHRLRILADVNQRRIIDLRGLAYFCFALATWNSCGAGGLPGYALYPDSVQATHSLAFLIGQYKVIMLYFIFGWLLLLMSLVRQTKQKY